MANVERCPHCASTKIADGICFTCARSVTEAPDLPRIDGLEETHLEPPRLKKRDAASAKADERKICMHCSVPNPADRDLCLACGQRL